MKLVIGHRFIKVTLLSENLLKILLDYLPNCFLKEYIEDKSLHQQNVLLKIVRAYLYANNMIIPDSIATMIPITVPFIAPLA